MAHLVWVRRVVAVEPPEVLARDDLSLRKLLDGGERAREIG